MHTCVFVTIQAGAVVVADLTDTLLQPHEAAAVFTVLVQQLQALEADRKLLVLDSAHEYLSAAAGTHAHTTNNSSILRMHSF
jgi:hypothetical protein